MAVCRRVEGHKPADMMGDMKMNRYKVMREFGYYQRGFAV
jgi:hypothetical protein